MPSGSFTASRLPRLASRHRQRRRHGELTSSMSRQRLRPPCFTRLSSLPGACTRPVAACCRCRRVALPSVPRKSSYCLLDDFNVSTTVAGDLKRSIGATVCFAERWGVLNQKKCCVVGTCARVGCERDRHAQRKGLGLPWNVYGVREAEFAE